MMAQNPTLGIGYLIGSALGENYWGKKRANSTQKAADDALNEYNKNLPANTSGEMDWDAANKILEAYAGNANPTTNNRVADAMNQKSGWFVSPEQAVANQDAAAQQTTTAEASTNAANNAANPKGSQYDFSDAMPAQANSYHLGDYSDTIGTEVVGDRSDWERQYAKQAMGLIGGNPQYFAPPTPQQANAPAITMDNAGVLGGATTMQDAWEQMKNSGTFNNGNTGYFTNGIRNLDNVVTTGTQAPAPSPAPAAPAQAGVNYVGTEPFIDKQAQIYMQAGASPEQARSLAARAGERIKRMYSDPRFLAQLNETQKKNWFGK